MSPSDLLASLQFRYATKQFDATRPIPDDSWQALQQSLILAPSSFGLQPWKFLVIDTPATRAELRECSWNQSQVTDAARLIVFTARTDLTDLDIDRFIRCLAAAQGKAPAELGGYRDIVHGFAHAMTPAARHAWNVRQAYIALGQFMASAAAIGIDTCPLEGIDTAAYDKILGLESSGYATAVACAVGYRSAADKYAEMPKARFPLEELIEHR
jgi:nitroreductase